MKYLIDTSVVSHLVRGDAALELRLASLPPTDRIYTSVIVEGELLDGALRLSGTRQQGLVERVESRLSMFAEILPITSAVAQSYAAIKSSLTVAGRIVPDNDIWIGASGLANGMIVVHHDKHFTHISQLETQDWIAE